MIISRPRTIIFILFVISIIATSLVFKPILKIAKAKNLVDNPDARKLQKNPVPVIGGIAVFFGIVVGLCFFKTTINYVDLFSTICAMMIMLYVGSIDDILDIPASLRLLLEIGVSLLIIYGTRSLMCNFQGVIGIDRVSLVPGIILSVVAMVGIMNAINMIDGVDGLSSGLAIFACSCFGLFYFLVHEYSYAALAAVAVGSLIPFFIHNVFGRETKMFLGDGGSLMVGILLASMCLTCLRAKEFHYYENFDISSFSLLAFCVSVMSVPVFDTLRVMTERIIEKKSPFRADKRHLHHLFLARGLKHIQASLSMICLNALVVISWLISYFAGASIGLQFGIAVAMSMLVTLGTSLVLKHSKK